MLTPVQAEMVMWTHVASNGGKVPKPSITTEEYEKSLARKASVQEFSEAMKRAKEANKSYEDLRADMELKAQSLGIKDVY